MAVSETDVFVRIKKACAEVLKVDQNKITLESRFKDDLGADSLDIISLLMVLEEEFKSAIPDEEAAKFIAVRDVVAFLTARPGSET